MTQVSQKLILELQRIMKEEYGRELSIVEAGEIANNLVSFYDLLLKVDAKTKIVGSGGEIAENHVKNCGE